MTSNTSHFSSPMRPLQQVRHIIAVGSGKGGVGKSTTTLNLALSLQQRGLKVGLLDTDLYGPNQPQMLGSQQTPDINQKSYVPVPCHGLATMSLGYIVQDDTPLIWRGPMVTKMLQQLLFQTTWPQLDVLLLDLPPGTGDVQLTLSKKVPLSGAIIVTTPQTVATQDAAKGIAMFEKVEVPILGIIENMSTHTCSQCGHTEAIFGEHGGSQLAKKNAITLLGKLPLESTIRQCCDEGKPYVLTYPNSATSQTFFHIADTIQVMLNTLEQNQKSTFPPIVVEN